MPNEEQDCNADQIRRKITKYIDSGAKIGEFCKTLNVSTTGYRRFMTQSGRDKGTGSDTFMEAWAFFKKREMAGLKMPQAKKVEPVETGSTRSNKKAKGDAIDVSDIHLDLEDQEAVPIFETCNEVRRKIRIYLKRPGVSKASLLRQLEKQFPEKPTAGLSTTSFTTFMAQHGNMRCSGSPIYYGAYCLFEKQRIKDGKMEEAWGLASATRDSIDRLWMRDDEHLEEDKYGKVVMYGPNGKRMHL